MEVSQATPTTESTTTTAVEQTNSTPVPSVEAQTSADLSTEAAPVPEVPQYQPNFKYKSLNQEYEFEDWAKGIIKDKETEEKVRKLHLKAAGLESIQQARDHLRSENQELKRNLSENEKAINQVIEFAQKGDFDSFCRATNVPIEKLLQFAVSYAQRTPAEQQSLEDRFKFQQEQMTYQQQLQQAEQRAQQAELRERERDLNFELSKPDIAQIAASFDARLNQPGAFRQEVIRRGQLHWATSQRDITPEEAIKEVIQLLGHQPSMDGQQVSSLGATPPKVVTPSQKPTIPNISGRGASVVKKAPRSIEDLRKLANAANGG